jgi:hypothetical protein
MQIMALLTLGLSLSWVACSSGSDAQPAAPPVFQVTTPTPTEPASVFGGVAGRPAPIPVGQGNLELAGHLEGQLFGIDVSADTTENSGSFERWAGGGGYLQMNIAAPGVPWGAAMMIVGVYGPDDSAFADGDWSGSGATTGGELAGAHVASCAGPVMGDWPWENLAVEYEMTLTADPEEPKMAVLAVAASFSVFDPGAPSNDLTGTFRFERPVIGD